MDEQRKYIDAEELKKRAYLVCGAEYYETPPFLAVAVETIDRIPAADVQPVKRGRWIGVSPLVDTFQCSICGYNILDEEMKTPFCPWCGASILE